MATSVTEAGMSSNGYPADLDVDLPERNSRLLAVLFFIFIKLLLSTPHLIVLMVYGFVAAIVAWIAQWAVLFTGSYPRGLHNFALGFLRWSWRLTAWYLGLTDRYPPFSGSDSEHPARADCMVPESSSRLLALIRIVPIIGFLMIPHIVVLTVLSFALVVVVVLAQLAAVFVGRFPEGLASFTIGFNRWSHRVECYTSGLVDRYPPFRMDS
ncbi:MAG: DUF4389 domain-containing protein [Chloroflexi bacterium]|nr:DUF4389 domain-containing protein [Chloroflexota bacterium]MCY3939347.1 DUF4389 domain-containing protein [Chloroflexota bacterium]